MYLLKDEIAFLRKVTTGQLVRMPGEREMRLIVQILISYRLIWLSGDHLIPADRGVSLLARIAGPRTTGISEARNVLRLSPERA